jgi:hypothetical protein
MHSPEVGSDRPGADAEPARSSPVRRALILAAVVLAASIPAVVAYGKCSGAGCDSGAPTHSYVPFCSLPSEVRTRIAAGYQDGRSPDLLTVSAGTPIVGSTTDRPEDLRVPWLSVNGPAETRIPLVFAGPGIQPASLPSGTGLDGVEPTLVRLTGITPPSRLRSGKDIPAVQRSGAAPRLIVLVAWEGIGFSDLAGAATPELQSLLRAGAGTLDADTGSLPVDPAAALATLGTGSLPSQHGITGTWLRSPYGGMLVHAGGPAGPPAEVPTFAQELIHVSKEASSVALVEPAASDQGLVGTEYFVADHRKPDVSVVAPGREVAAARSLMHGGLGSGAGTATDVLGVVLRGPVLALDRETKAVLADVASATGGSYLAVVAGTGSTTVPAGSMAGADAASALTKRLPAAAGVIKAVVPGGIYLAKTTAHTTVSGRDIVKALLGLPAPSGGHLMKDSFDSFAVSLGKYCR